MYSFFDERVSTTYNIVALFAVILTIANSVLQLIKTSRIQTASDFYGPALIMRVISNAIWVVFSIEINSMLLLASSLITFFSLLYICFICYKLSPAQKYGQKKLQGNKVKLIP